MIWKTIRAYKNDTGQIVERNLAIFIDEDFKVGAIEAAYGFDPDKFCSLNSSATGEVVIKENWERATDKATYALLNSRLLPIDKEI